MELVLDRQKSQAWDKATFSLGLPSEILMAMAAQGAFSALESQKWYSRNKKFIVLAGSGNNGGDGYVLAWILASLAEKKVQVFFYENPRTKDCQFFFELCQKNPQIEIFPFSEFSFQNLNEEVVIIDALFGTGFNKPLALELSEFFRKLNETKAMKVAIDIPSGVYADGDFFSHTPFKADLTLSIGSFKVGQLLPPGIYYCGKIQVVHTGFVPYGVSTARLAKKIEWTFLRKFSGHKYTSGVLHIWGGSSGMEGAAILSATAFLAAGGGLVRYFTTSPNAYTYLNQNPEIMVRYFSIQNQLENELFELLQKQKKPILAIGMGLSEVPSQTFLENLAELNGLKLICDAGFLNQMISFKPIFQNREKDIVLIVTPHLKEAERLLGMPITNIHKAALQIAQEYHAYVYFKGAGGLLVSPVGEEIYFNSHNYVLATGGTGDVLNGIIANFLLRFEDPLLAIEQAILFYLKAAEKFQDKPDFFVASNLVQIFRESYEIL